MTTPFPVTTPRARVLDPFIILSDFDDEITTLPVRPKQTSPDYIALTSVVHPPPSLFPSSSSPPPSLSPSPSSPSLFPSSSRKRPRLPLPPPPPVLPPPLAVLPPPSAPLPPEVVVLEVTATTTLVRLHRMVEARRWTFAIDSIDVWRYQEGEPIYEILESSLAKIHPITVRRESDKRIETLEQEFETLRGRGEDVETRLQRCEADIRELRAHIRRLGDHFDM
ncbi:hypothetical protein Tco_0825206 [Tanacetum coccineum]